MPRRFKSLTTASICSGVAWSTKGVESLKTLTCEAASFRGASGWNSAAEIHGRAVVDSLRRKPNFACAVSPLFFTLFHLARRQIRLTKRCRAKLRDGNRQGHVLAAFLSDDKSKGQ